LRSRRVQLGLSLEEVAETTRVRRTYLEALEQVAYDVLPSRAFAIGYVKAYARALGLDEESLADIYKREIEDGQVKLQAPVGAALDDVQPNNRRYVAAALIIVALIIGWNIIQRRHDIMTEFRNAKAEADKGFINSNGLIYDGKIYVARPAPPPPDQDIPAPYYTPGLEAQFAALEAQKRAGDTVYARASDVLQQRKAFNPQGAIFGASPAGSNVIIQAKSAANMVVRTSGGAVLFAQQLLPGAAYRVPLGADQQSLLVDVSDFKAFEVYYNGEFAGTLDAATMTIGKINSRAVAQAKALDQSESKATVVVNAPAPTNEIEIPTLPVQNDEPLPYIPNGAPPHDGDNDVNLATSAAPQP
jgi:transcriptional regulator with XRE-family HTH domain